MAYKTSELTGARLDQAVAKACGYMYDKAIDREVVVALDGSQPMMFFSYCAAAIDGKIRKFSPSSDWADGGPIIENNWREIRVELELGASGIAWHRSIALVSPNTLQTFMRAFVAAKLGEEVEL